MINNTSNLEGIDYISNRDAQLQQKNRFLKPQYHLILSDQ